jgi:NAD(P)-dependent dehydrogenase (short-subunit alcohol dehydrogenase family)
MPSAIVTGGTSGIGRALAVELARRGWDLALTARRESLLSEVAGEIGQQWPSRRVVVRALDVTDAAATRNAVRELFAALGDVELVVANAGIGGNHRVGTGEFGRSRDIVATNLIGAMATVDAAVECWRAHPASGPRRIVGITSVAGFRGLPGSSAYSASKAGLSVYLEAARGEVRGLGIEVVDIAPGFIDTPINQDLPTRPFVIDVQDGARRIADLIERGVRRSTVPVWPWNVIGWVMRRIPDVAWTRLSGNMHRGRASQSG